MICRMAMIDFGSLWENVATDCPIAICRVVTMMHRTKAPSDEGAVSEADWGRESRGIAMVFSPSGPSGHLIFWCDCRRQSIISDSLRDAPPSSEGGRALPRQCNRPTN